MADWEQLEGESDAAYARFLVYRNLGPGRSLDSAYRWVSFGGVGKRTKPQGAHANGQWSGDCAKYNWVERAAKWDIELLTQIGQGVVVKYIHALDKFAEKILQVLEADGIQPSGWQGAVDAIVTLGNFIPAETVEAVQDAARSGRMSAIGRNPEPESRVTVQLESRPRE